MNKIMTVAIILLSMAATTAQATIGEWKTYMAYSDITDIEPAGNIVYVLSSGSIFSYNVNDESITTYNKVYPLSDCNITNIAWNSIAKRLIIIYDNYNIDLLDNSGNVYNILDYYNKVMTEDKTVNNITTYGEYAYLCTAFGIIKINMRNAEIRDTYNFGKNVTHCTITKNRIYANTTQGIYAGNLSDNLLDPSKWTPSSDNVSFSNKNDITLSTANGYNEYIAYDHNNKCYWSNQNDGKLQGYVIDDDNVKTITVKDVNPACPKYNYFGFMKTHNGKLYTCGGTDWEKGKNACIQVLDNNNWTIFQDDEVTQKTGLKYRDVMCIDIHPDNDNIVAAGARNGLYIFENGKLSKFYNNENSPIESVFYPINKEYELITGLKYKPNGSLLFFNSMAPTQSIIELDVNGKFIEHKKNELMVISGNSARKMKNPMIYKSNKDFLWFVTEPIGHHPATYCYNMNNDNLYEYNYFINEDGMSLNVINVRDIAEDEKGNIIVGTDVGLLFLLPEHINDPSKGYYQIKVPRNDGTNFADYLLTGIDITSIALDGGNRKWIGTNGLGVYLISEDYMEQIEHFTTENSPLLSNIINSISINDNTGEVFFGTDKGLCSYMSDASMPNEDMKKDNVWAFPNPVTPDYTGLITVTGLSHNANVKIVTVNGTLVAQGKSNGGTFTWDGNDLKGKRVASGVYMIQTATSDGGKGTVCKIAIIN